MHKGSIVNPDSSYVESARTESRRMLNTRRNLMYEHAKTLAQSESTATELKASQLTVGTFSALVPEDVGVLKKVQDADGNESYWFEPSDGSKKLLFDANKAGRLKPMSGCARKLGDLGILPKISTHPQPKDYASEKWWFDYANRHGIDPDDLRKMSEVLQKAAKLRAQRALGDAVAAAGGMDKLRQLMERAGDRKSVV